MVDTVKSLLTYIYSLLTADATLITAMGGTVRLYATWAVTDATFPYIVHRFSFRQNVLYPERVGTYYIDLWSDSTNAEEVLSIRKRVVELLDQLNFNTVEVKNVRLNLDTDGFVPENDPEIWHYAMQFDIDIWRQSELVSIINR